MAEALSNEISKQKSLDVVSDSAGISAIAGISVSENALSVLKEIGIDARTKSSKNILSLHDLDDIDIFAVMSNAHREILLSIGINKNKIYVLGNGIDDPFSRDENVYRETRNQIKEAILKMFDEIIEKDEK